MDLIRGARSVAGVLISNGILPAACSGAVKNKYRNEFVVRRVVDALSHSSRLARDVVGSRGGPRTAEGEEIEGCRCTECSRRSECARRPQHAYGAAATGARSGV